MSLKQDKKKVVARKQVENHGDKKIDEANGKYSGREGRFQVVGLAKTL